MNTAIPKTYATILAGGIGSRFWPKSRAEKPKQYLSLVDDGTLIQNTTARLQGLFSKETIYIVTTKAQQRLLAEQLPWLPFDHILFEPMGRNTAPAVGLAAIHLLDLDPDAIMVVLPADHRITKTKHFLATLNAAINIAAQDQNALVTLGITPTYPATGYGYIESGRHIDGDAFKVNRFTEKPALALSQKFIQQGNYYWNSGIFIWRAAAILQEIKKLMPELYAGLAEIQAVLHKNTFASVCAKVYAACQSQSIDFGVMEKAENVYMVRADIGWSDVGTWEEVYNISKKDAHGNVVKGQALLKDVTNSYIETNDRTISIIGCSDLIVVDQHDALLICKKDQSQDVRWVTNELLQSPQKKNRL